LAPDGSSLKHLCQCAAEGNRWHIELLLEAELSGVNTVDKMGSSALMTAAEFGHLGSIELLIQKNADVDKIRESDQVTAVYQAAKGGHTACVRMLHERGSRGNPLISTKSQTGAKSHNALTVTASNGSAACMQVLCKGNAVNAALTQDELDSPGLAGLPALCWALEKYHLECIDVLIGTNSQKCTAQ
jgi:ankyrin repeat protein